ncbi:MAG: hypothetical protein COT06_08220 [Syntrophobacteraceae bacterium CG07_land_8_20_14_0_80_61_8]|nr:MAG: hypothetical protein COT06_08220 [Syntrophobacteraceae bacterium CG07_land_8_20_14_0_80_61_8]
MGAAGANIGGNQPREDVIMFSIQEILSMAIRIEENGERFYRQAIARISDQSLASVLLCLAEEEVRHQQMFRELREASEGSGKFHWAEDIGGSMLQNVVGDQTFSLKELDPAHFTSEWKILKAAIEFENDTILFMEMIRDFVTDAATLQQLNDLIAEEQRHKETLHRCLHCRQPACQELKALN